MFKYKNAATLSNKSYFVASHLRRLGTQAAPNEEHSLKSNMIELLQEKMKALQQAQLDGGNISIYRVPEKLRKVEPRAYDPHFISIGPYHHGLPKLQASEKLKLESLNRLLGPGGRTKGELSNLVEMVAGMEQEARSYYAEVVDVPKDDFVKMMLLDGCFVVQLLRDLKQSNFAYSSLLSKRWMLHVVRQDLITLENQLPFIVLKSIFQETNIDSSEETSIEELALNFFDPLMPREPHILKQRLDDIITTSNAKHLLDLFHSSIALGDSVRRRKEAHMYRSVTELKEAGIKVRVLRNTQPLDMRFERGVLRMPCLQIDDHTGSLFRNIVAYEQCHQDSKPDMTTYLFFLDKLINSAEDVGLLHYGEVIQHSLGSNKQLAKLVNNICVEVEHNGEESYLCEVVQDMNDHSRRWWGRTRARLRHDYFTNVWVSLSTLAALVLLYLTLVQTTCDVIGARRGKPELGLGMWGVINWVLVHPFEAFKKMCVSVQSHIIEAYASDSSEDQPFIDGP